MATTPFAVIFLWHINYNLGGYIGPLLNDFFEYGILTTFIKVLPTPTFEVFAVLAAYITFEAFLMVIIPGKTHKGPITEHGHVPIYNANGFQAYFITLSLLLSLHYFQIINLGWLYDNFGSMILALNITSLFVCLALYFKGMFAPSGPDHSFSGNVVLDYYWGVELYPRIGPIDLKVLVNCRTAMMGWAILTLAYAVKQHQVLGYVSDSMIISVIVQLIYISKFFWWETGYMDSIDIMHDRFGFYICWGCLVWLPSLYTNCTFYLVSHPIQLNPIAFYAILFAGILSVYINYNVDEQRQKFRKNNGNINIWGKKATYIDAKFQTVQGEEKHTKLLTSGWWGVSRHANYTFELAAALLWSPPVQFHQITPYLYFIFLTLLLLHRAIRDEERCLKKYGKSYTQYKKQVPYFVIPGIF